MTFLKRISLTLAIILLCVNTSFAEHSNGTKYAFRQVNSRTGLSDNNIRNLLMLPNGMIVLYSPMMLSLYDGTSYHNQSFNSTFVPFKEYSTDVDLVATPNDKVIILNGDRTWYFDTARLRFCYHDTDLCGVELRNVKSIILDDQNNYIIYTKDGLLQSYNTLTKTLSRIETPAALSGDVKMARSGSYIYIVTRSGALMKYDTRLSVFTNVVTNLIDDNLKEISRFDIEISSKGDIFVMYDFVVRHINPRSFDQTIVASLENWRENIYTSIAIDPDDKLWIGSSKSGVTTVDINSGEVDNPTIEVIDNTNHSGLVEISNIYIDSKGGVWIATESEGMLYYHKNMFRFDTVNNRVENEDAKCMTLDKDGNILIGTSNGLYCYNPTADTVTVPFKELYSEACISLYRDSKDRIWVGTFRNGAYCIDNGKIRNYSYPEMPTIEESYHSLTPNYNCVRSVFEDSNGDFWISVYGGLAQFDTKSGKIELISKRFPKLSHIMFVRDITQAGDAIFASSNDGYFSYSLTHEDIETYPSNSNIYDRCNQAIKDSKGVVWVATSMGLRVVVDGRERQVITTNDGLISNNIVAVAEDKLSNIWAFSPSSASRISIIDRGDGSSAYRTSITSFTASDGLDAGIIYPKSTTSDKSGNIYIGGSHGFCIINPERLYQINNKTKPILTNLYVNNTLIKVGKEFNKRVLLNKGIASTKKIVLNHNESFISFDFSNLNYTNPNHTLYRYKLENFDQKWHQINSKEAARATYTLLQPGKYTFKVIAANNGTDWNNEETQLSVVIKPPFYQSRLAYIIYFILIMLLMFLILHLVNARNIEKLAKREQMEHERLNQMKFRFFTNISHELRTPLSLILLPLNNIIRKTPKDSEITPQLLTIERNASHLLSLVNHLLDFRKLEVGGEKLTLTKNNTAELCEAIIADFSNIASEKRIALSVVDKLNNRTHYFDISHITKVINNLVSNALKFTPDGGSVTITLSYNDDNLIIEVSDTGVGISKDDQALIFDRFYQVKEHEAHSTGSGIGLHLVKQYIELHKGSLSVESQVGAGSTFRIELPSNSPEVQNEEQTNIQEVIECDDHTENEESIEVSDKFKILLVEDNTDFRNYLAMELKALNYEIHTAVDGEDGITKAREVHPSLIISDIMMPKCDGFTLCNTLKNDIDTSHIPIILLTARTADDVRYEGYKAGADAFLSKPFSFDVLNIRISKLIEERQHRYEQIKSPEKIQTSQITISSLDEKLMAQIIENIEKNMSNTEYSIEQLSSDVAMHRMNLYRKIQSIAGMTPSEFLRTMRIKRAAQLLDQDSGLSIIEISEMVGFNTPKYFTAYFKKAYGVTPSQYAADIKSKKKK